jgi:hypothetical protein
MNLLEGLLGLKVITSFSLLLRFELKQLPFNLPSFLSEEGLAPVLNSF